MSVRASNSLEFDDLPAKPEELGLGALVRIRDAPASYKTPERIGSIGRISQVPMHPNTWYKVVFEDGVQKGYRAGAFSADDGTLSFVAGRRHEQKIYEFESSSMINNARLQSLVPNENSIPLGNLHRQRMVEDLTAEQVNANLPKLVEGAHVRIRRTKDVQDRLPERSGQIGTLATLPPIPGTWYRVLFPDGDIRGFNASSLDVNIDSVSEDSEAESNPERPLLDQPNADASPLARRRATKRLGGNAMSPGSVTPTSLSAKDQLLAEQYVGKHVRVRYGRNLNEIGVVTAIRPGYLVLLMTTTGETVQKRRSHCDMVDGESETANTNSGAQMPEADSSSVSFRSPPSRGGRRKGTNGRRGHAGGVRKVGARHVPQNDDDSELNARDDIREEDLDDQDSVSFVGKGGKSKAYSSSNPMVSKFIRKKVVVKATRLVGKVVYYDPKKNMYTVRLHENNLFNLHRQKESNHSLDIACKLKLTAEEIILWEEFKMANDLPDAFTAVVKSPGKASVSFNPNVTEGIAAGTGISAPNNSGKRVEREASLIAQLQKAKKYRQNVMVQYLKAVQEREKKLMPHRPNLMKILQKFNAEDPPDWNVISRNFDEKVSSAGTSADADQLDVSDISFARQRLANEGGIMITIRDIPTSSILGQKRGCEEAELKAYRTKKPLLYNPVSCRDCNLEKLIPTGICYNEACKASPFYKPTLLKMENSVAADADPILNPVVTSLLHSARFATEIDIHDEGNKPKEVQWKPWFSSSSGYFGTGSSRRVDLVDNSLPKTSVHQDFEANWANMMKA